MVAKERLTRQEAQSLVPRLHQSWKAAQDNMAQAQKRYVTQANKHRREPDFGVGDKVWVSAKHWKTDRPSKKLSNQNEGPFKIIEQVGHSYKLQLPDSVKVHPVFYAKYLCKAPEDLLPGQSNTDPLPIKVDEYTKYKVDFIHAVKLKRYRLWYRV